MTNDVEYLCLSLHSLLVFIGGLFCRPSSLSGSVEGVVILYRRGNYPFGTIGPVRFMWRPAKKHSPLLRSLWLWCHPSIYDEIMEQLLNVFEISQEKFTEACSLPKFSVSNYNEEQPEVTTPVLQSADGHVTVTLLKDKLCRFRILGISAQAAVTAVVQGAGCVVTGCGTCWSTDQKRVWQQVAALTSSAYLPPSTVLGVVCRDPRVFLPAKKTQAKVQTLQQAVVHDDGKRSLAL